MRVRLSVRLVYQKKTEIERERQTDRVVGVGMRGLVVAGMVWRL